MSDVQTTGVVEAFHYASIIVGYIQTRGKTTDFTVEDIINGHVACRQEDFNPDKLREALTWLTAFGFISKLKDGAYTLDPPVVSFLPQVCKLALDAFKDGDIEYTNLIWRPSFFAQSWMIELYFPILEQK